MESVFTNNTKTNILDLIATKEVDPNGNYNELSSSLIKSDYELNHLKYELLDIKVEYFDVKKCTENTHLTEYRNDSLDMIFFISGTLHIMFKDRSELVFPNRHNLCYTAPEKIATDWKLDSKDLQVLIISLPKDIFLQYPNTKIQPLSHFLERMQGSKSSRLHPDCMPITKEMNLLLNDIIYCKKENHAKWIFLESKVKELLVLQIEQCNKGFFKNNYGYKAESVQKIHKTKAYIEAHLANRLSLPELAKKVGTNTFTLKKGLKEIYGTTLFN